MPAPDLTADVARATSLREGPEGVAAFLRAVYHHEPVTLSDLARLVKLPLPVASAVRRELEKRDILERREGVRLTAAGRTFVEETLGVKQATAVAFGDARLAGALEIIARHVAAEPAADVTLDQAPCTPETALNRALLLLKDQGLNGRRLIVLGDDDLISLAVAITARALGILETIGGITAIDVDPRQLDHIASAAKAEGLALDCVQHDLREPLPQNLRGTFDVFETDPPYTLEGARLFLSRGLEALKDGSGYRAMFSYAEAPPDDALALQELFNDLGLVATGVHPAFNRYQGATVLGSTGRLYELVTTTSSPHESAPYLGPLYTAEIAPRTSLYQCTSCNTRTPVGPAETIKLISDLKQRGCPKCGEHSFRRAGTAKR